MLISTGQLYKWLDYQIDLLILVFKLEIVQVIYVFKRNQHQRCFRWFAPILVFVHFYLSIYVNQHTLNLWDKLSSPFTENVEKTSALPSRWQIIHNRNNLNYVDWVWCDVRYMKVWSPHLMLVAICIIDRKPHDNTTWSSGNRTILRMLKTIDNVWQLVFCNHVNSLS